MIERASNEHDMDNEHWDNYKGGTTEKITKEYKNHVIAYLIEDELKDKTVLDLGCGVGRLSLMFDIGEYIGVDTCVKMLQKARDLGAMGTFKLGDGKNIPQEANSVDYVICNTVALHLKIETLENYMWEVHRVLRPYGVFLINVPISFPLDFFKKFPFDIQSLDGSKMVFGNTNYILYMVAR